MDLAASALRGGKEVLSCSSSDEEEYKKASERSCSLARPRRVRELVRAGRSWTVLDGRIGRSWECGLMLSCAGYQGADRNLPFGFFGAAEAQFT